MWFSLYYLLFYPLIALKCCISIYLTLGYLFLLGFLWNNPPCWFSLCLKFSHYWVFWIFSFQSRPHFIPHTWLASSNIFSCFTESQTQLPPNGAYYPFFYIIWNLGSSINNCVFLKPCVIKSPTPVSYTT